MGKYYNHLTLEDRLKIEKGIINQLSFTAIGESIEKDRTAVMREVVRNRQYYPGPSTFINDRCGRFNDCPVIQACTSPCLKTTCAGCELICNEQCEHYTHLSCPSLFKAPYVCNKCSKRKLCNFNKVYYNPKYADDLANKRLVERREGADITEEDLIKQTEIIKNGVDRKLSLYRIVETNGGEEAFGCTLRTLYNRLDNGVYEGVNASDMVYGHYKPRKKQPDYGYKVDRKCLQGRRYEDFLEFMERHPDVPVVEMDTVEGNKEERSRFLLSLLFRNCNLQLAYVIRHQRTTYVTDVFDMLWERLGAEIFKKLFPVILTDNGSEFSNPGVLEYSKEGIQRTRIFYCHPNASFEKGKCENNHKEIRKWQPKGKPILMTQHEAYFMMSNINSTPRKIYGGLTPLQLFMLIYQDVSIIKKLGLREIPAEEVCLDPSLFK